MDYKEKYEQALERCKKEFNFNNLAYSHEQIKQRLERVFPELKESEDERMWKLIKKYAHSNISDMVLNANHITRGQLESWLEKQREQKPEIKYIYPKFRVGDVIEPAKPNGHYVPVRVKYIGEGRYSCESDDRKAFLSLPICDENDYVLTKQKSAEWSENDEEWMKSTFDKLSIGGDMCLGEK